MIVLWCHACMHSTTDQLANGPRFTTDWLACSPGSVDRCKVRVGDPGLLITTAQSGCSELRAIRWFAGGQTQLMALQFHAYIYMYNFFISADVIEKPPSRFLQRFANDPFFPIGKQLLICAEYCDSVSLHKKFQFHYIKMIQFHYIKRFRNACYQKLIIFRWSNLINFVFAYLFNSH